jgi:hypothetical protein
MTSIDTQVGDAGAALLAVLRVVGHSTEYAGNVRLSPACFAGI